VELKIRIFHIFFFFFCLFPRLLLLLLLFLCDIHIHSSAVPHILIIFNSIWGNEILFIVEEGVIESAFLTFFSTSVPIFPRYIFAT